MCENIELMRAWNETFLFPKELPMTTLFPPSRHRLMLATLAVLLLVSLACALPSALQPAAPGVTATPAPTPTITPTPQPLPPALIEMDPPPGTRLPLDGALTLYFNQPMQRATVETALRLELALEDGTMQPLAVNYNWLDDTALQLLPTEQLPTSATVILVLDAAAQAANGLTMLDSVRADYATLPPLEVAQFLPEPGLSDIDPASALVVTFNQPVVPLGADPATLPAALLIEPAVEGHGEWVNTSTYIYYPEIALFGGAYYDIRLDPSLQSNAGARLASESQWSFITSSPELLSAKPADGAGGIPLDQPITLTFNQSMDPVSVEGNFTLYDAANNFVPGRFEWEENNTVMIFTPDAPLARSSQYLIHLPFGAQALGGTPLGETYELVFRTIPGLMVVSTDPYQGGESRPYRGVSVFFSGPLLDNDDLLDYIRITPGVENASYWWNNDSNVLNLHADFQPLTEYQITLDASLPDPWGSTLGFDYPYTFTTSALEPTLRFGHYDDTLFLTPRETSLTAQATNLSYVDTELGALPFSDFLTFLQPGNYDYFDNYLPPSVQSWGQTLDLPGDRIYAAELMLSPDGSGLDPGLYFMRLDAPDVDYPPGPYILVSSNLNLTFKLSSTQALVWAVDLRTNIPAAGLVVGLYDPNGVQLSSGITDTNGIATFDIPPQEDMYVNFYALTGQPGDDLFGLTVSRWTQGIDAYEFGLNSDYSGAEVETYLYTDRPIYRPGQTVYFRAVARTAYDGRYTPADLQTLPISFHDSNSNTLFEAELPLSVFGTAHGEYSLPENALPGAYHLATPYDTLWFDVAEYRKPEINLQVDLPATGENALDEQGVAAQVDARYYFDAPAGNIPLSWDLYAAPAYFYISGGYRVGPDSYGWLYPSWMGNAYGTFGAQVDYGNAQTDTGGILNLELEIPPAERTQTYTLEVTLTDESGFPISARHEWRVHPAETYIGVRPDAWVGRAGLEMGFDILTVNWEKQPAPDAALSAAFRKVTWERTDSGDPYMPPELVPVYENIASAELRTGADGAARLAFTPPEAGTYQLEITSPEGALTQALIWVGGAGRAIWPNLPNQIMRLSADAESYQPGDTAQLFIPNPLGAGTQALVTVERGAISEHFTLAINENGHTLELPLNEDDAPNVYIAVTLIGPNEAGRMDFRQAYLNLPVSPQAMELNIEILAVSEGRDVTCDSGANCSEQLEPRSEISVDVRVTDAAGNPVLGEFSLAVADLAALALADPNSVEIMQFFYDEQPLGVRTSLGLTMHAQREMYIPGGMGGGGGDAMPPIVREDFPDTAYWSAEIITDNDGRATATFTLPDSLTTWHLDARGLTMDTRVGQAESYIVTSRELLVRPVTPRFFVAGDHSQISAIVHNNSAEDLRVDVALQASGFSLDDPAIELQRVDVPAGGRAELAWWGTVQDAESVAMIFSATGENLQGEVLYQDITRPVWGDLPVVRYLAPQRFGTAGTLDAAGQRLELVSLPQSFDTTSGELALTLSPSLAAAMTAGLEILEHYPYECTEQTVSRFLPNLETYRAIQSLGLDAPELAARLDRTLDFGLARLMSTQNSDGGWGWWPVFRPAWDEIVESDPYITAYVLFALSRASDAGVFVNKYDFEDAEEYLWATLPTVEMTSQPWMLDRMVFQAFALTHARRYSQAESGSLAGLLDSLYAVSEQLSPWAQALLAQSYAVYYERSGGSQEQILFSNLQSTAVRTAAGIHWEGGSARQNMETAAFNTAVVVYALAQQDPASVDLPEAVRWLMAHRGVSGGWSSTYETAWSLMGLTEFMRGTGELAGDYAYTANLNGGILAEGQAGGDTRLTDVTAEVPVAQLFTEYPNALTISRDDGPGRLYYTAYLNVMRPVEDVEALSAGVNIQRAYYNIENPTSDVTTSVVGDTVEVHLTLTLENEAYYLAVEDYIPAGAEVLNTSLKTSQQGIAEYNTVDPFGDGWGWWFFNEPQIYDDHIAWTVDYLPAGTYELTYLLTINQPGEYRVIPARAWEFYFPEVQGNGAGAVFIIEEN